ncbi:hypothetical protein BCR36DRAFT_375024 [Piromyces finnis]|uniref:Alpha/beta-hydrolase n=1 Tax=Piromyces finnis TaxID=1754191 RepID=A0A1Y1UX69_9FUNG|nr:hypothetical protein BCR36DRAFT_375024 [Piromyces finnis]|eukprot:ORX41820.1 hypothetical protein BCR36DRAFT_375024 [Piromyces finnis]
MFLNHSFISIELSLPVNNDYYYKLKEANEKELCNNLFAKFDNKDVFLTGNNENSHFKIDILIPKNYKIGNKTCLFIHGSGSSKLSSRNKYVANGLLEMNLCCCLMNLFTAEEEKIDNVTRENRFNIELLTSRVLTVVDYLLNIDQLIQKEKFKNFINCMNCDEEISTIINYLSIISKNKMILFGSSTGAAAALFSTYYKSDRIAGVISRGGRPDLVPSIIIKNFPCYSTLYNHAIPVLFIVGSNDYCVSPLNKKIYIQIGQGLELKEKQKQAINENHRNREYSQNKKFHPSSINNCNTTNNNYYLKEWRWVENASHLFTENGAIEKVLQYTKEWIKNLN